MKDRKNMVMIIIIGITISLFLCFNTTAFATTGKVANDNLRLRKEKNTTSEILTLLDQNAEVEIVNEDGDWYKIKANGKVGYVNKQYIKLQNSNNNLTSTANNVTNSANNSTNNLVETESKVESNNVAINNVNTTNSTIENSQTGETVENTTKTIQYATILAETKIKIIPLINGDEINNAAMGEKYEVVNTAGLWSYIKNDTKRGWVLKEKLNAVEDNNSNKVKDSNVSTNGSAEKKDDTETQKSEEKASTEKIYSKPKTYYVSGTSVNARSKADKTSDSIAKLTTNDEVKVTGEDADWYIVSLDGKKGYIIKTLLSTKKVETTSRSESSLDNQTIENSENVKTEEESETKQNVKEETTTTSSNPNGSAIVAYAKTFVGYPYVYGTNGPDTFDCSGFVQYVYKHFGYSISRSSKTQVNDGVTVAKSDLQPGDIIIFKNTAKTEIGHVGIYIGGGQFVHASNPSNGVMISSLETAAYQARYVTARRIL